MDALKIKGLEKKLEGKAILSGLNLSLSEGSVYGLLGLNGAGKTTLIKTLAGLYTADSGEIQLLGDKADAGSLALKQKLGYVAEIDLLPAWASISDLCHLERSLRPGSWAQDDLDDWMKKQKLDPERKAASLSKGQRKRLELELLLAAKPRLLLLDEPLSGLDPVSRLDFMERLIGYVADRSATVLMSSHILGDLERLCDRIGILQDGQIVLELGMEELKEKAVLVSWTGKGEAKAPSSTGKILASVQDSGGGQHWVVLKKTSATAKAPASYRMRQESLEEMGAHLLRGLESREARHV
ncbi:MAG: ABC transporter ATP-binding protein [candidate division FCPU426 bacterium]